MSQSRRVGIWSTVELKQQCGFACIQAGLLELEQLCQNQRKALEAVSAESRESQSIFEEVRFDAHAATTYAVAVRGWALAAEKEAQLALEMATEAREEELHARMRRCNRGLETAEELAVQERERLCTEEAEESEELRRAEERLKIDACKADELEESLKRIQAETNELRSQAAPISARAAELRRRKHALEPAANSVGIFPERALPSLQAQLDAVEKNVHEEEACLHFEQVQEQEQQAATSLFASEIQAQRQVTQELLSGFEPQELRLEAVEAREKWQEIAQRDEHIDWQQRAKTLQQKGREVRKANRAVVESRQEVDSMMLQDSLRQEVAELERSTEKLQKKISELDVSTAVEGPFVPLVTLEQEMSAVQAQRSAALEDMEGLRSEFQAQVSAPSSAQAQPSQARASSREASARPARSAKRLNLHLSQGAVHREALQKQLQSQKQEEDRLRRQLKEVEQQLQLSRDDAERRRNFISQLQRSLEAEQSFEPPEKMQELGQTNAFRRCCQLSEMCQGSKEETTAMLSCFAYHDISLAIRFILAPRAF